ncbi:MAG: RimK family alpha-L-glutamate ligase [Patescibacteria group bacterium]|nr:RimK family alpha-L-glutamate ligase [Patescibacteria group bacterium]
MTIEPIKGRIAILYDSNAPLTPSNPKAIEKFQQAADKMNYEADIISRADSYRLHDYDILFIRDTTAINNYTYEMAMMAENLGLIVVDDPKSIVVCCDKAKQFRLFKDNGIPIPLTYVIDKTCVRNPIINKLSRPYIVKNPYSCFSKGVYKVDAPTEYERFAYVLLEKLDKIIVQEFIQTEFDWRICIFGGRIIFACKYFMSPGHWKILKHTSKGEPIDGDSEGVDLKNVPIEVLEVALKAASVIGDGLYGLDIKQKNGKVYVIEVNDNLNIDHGNEDALLGDKLYEDIISRLVHLHRRKVFQSRDV